MIRQKNILLVVNPVSGDMDKEEIVNKIQNRVGESNRLNIYKTTGDQDFSKIKELLEKNAVDRVVAVGGDGTIKLVTEAFSDYDFTIGIIPAGSSNGFATNFNLPENLDDAISVALGENVRQLDVLCINNQLCLHISDFGINAELIKNYSDSWIRGKLGYALYSIPTFIKSEYPYSFTIKANGKVVKKKAVMLAITNCKKFGTGAVINPIGKEDDRKFEILIFKKMDIIEIFKTLVDEVELSDDFLEVIQTNEAIIKNEDSTLFQIDGESQGEPEEVKAVLFSKQIKIAVGR